MTAINLFLIVLTPASVFRSRGCSRVISVNLFFLANPVLTNEQSDPASNITSAGQPGALPSEYRDSLCIGLQSVSASGSPLDVLIIMTAGAGFLTAS